MRSEGLVSSSSSSSPPFFFSFFSFFSDLPFLLVPLDFEGCDVATIRVVGMAAAVGAADTGGKDGSVVLA